MAKQARKRVSKHSAAIRKQAIADYAVHGSIKTVSNGYPDIPYDTIRSWVNSEEGQALITALHGEKTTELRSKYVEVCELAIEHTKLKLPEATAAQSAVISGVFFDKTRLIDNAPTSISSSAQTPQQVADQFMKMIQASDKAIVPKSKIIEHED